MHCKEFQEALPQKGSAVKTSYLLPLPGIFYIQHENIGLWFTRRHYSELEPHEVTTSIVLKK